MGTGDDADNKLVKRDNNGRPKSDYSSKEIDAEWMRFKALVSSKDKSNSDPKMWVHTKNGKQVSNPSKFKEFIVKHEAKDIPIVTPSGDRDGNPYHDEDGVSYDKSNKLWRVQ